MSQKTITPTRTFQTIEIGLLGAAAHGPNALAQLPEERLRTIERRVLRIEAALRGAGIPIDSLPLDIYDR